MRVFNSKNWKLFLALSVIIPVGLMSTFKLAGFMSGSVAITETRTLKPVNWEFERPDVGMLNIGENVSGYFSSDDAQIDERIIVYTFEPSTMTISWPTFEMCFELTSSVPKGHVAEVNVTVEENSSGHSVVLLPGNAYLRPNRYENLSISGEADCSTGLTGSERAFFTLTNPIRSAGAYVLQHIWWVLMSQYNESNFLFVNAEVTYYNGTVYKRVVQPFQLEVDPHFNNSFETAEEIGLNQTRRAFIAGYGHDTVDYYKTWLQSGTSATWQLVDARRWGEAMEIRVYDPDVQLRSCLLYPTNSSSQQLTVTINKTGWWYVRLDATAGEGVYRLAVLNSTG